MSERQGTGVGRTEPLSGGTTRLGGMGQKEAARPRRPGADATDAAGSPDTTGGTADDASADIASMSYEQARDELVDIVARLENGESGLEESMGL